MFFGRKKLVVLPGPKAHSKHKLSLSLARAKPHSRAGQRQRHDKPYAEQSRPAGSGAAVATGPDRLTGMKGRGGASAGSAPRRDCGKERRGGGKERRAGD